jgi:hypothetical protein
MPYITTDRVKQAFTNFNDDDDIILKDILDGVLAFVKRYTAQSLELTTYYEQHDTNELGYFQLKERPVASIIRVATTANVLQIQNTTAQRATISVTDTGVTLNSATNGVVATPVSITFAGQLTMTAMASAISAVSGWTATVLANYGSFESSLLSRAFGIPCITPIMLDAFTQDVPFTLQDPATIRYSTTWFGFATTRVDYTAGNATCPDDLALAISELCRLTYDARQFNPSLVSYSNGAYSWTKAVAVGFEQLSLVSRKTLARYKVDRLTGAFLI